MGFQHNNLFRKFEIDRRFIPADGSVGHFRWEFRTERPGTAGQVTRASGLITLAAGEFSRRPQRINLPGETRGHQYQLHFKPATTSDGIGQLLIYGIRVYAKIQQPHQATGWQWYPVPMEGTSDTWTESALPGIEPSSKNWSEAPLPVEPTAKTFRESRLPIESTADSFREFRVPVDPTAPSPSWVTLPVDR